MENKRQVSDALEVAEKEKLGDMYVKQSAVEFDALLMTLTDSQKKSF